MVIKRAEPDLLPLFKEGPALEKRLRFKELQTSFVYTTVIAKKCKVNDDKIKYKTSTLRKLATPEWGMAQNKASSLLPLEIS